MILVNNIPIKITKFPNGESLVDTGFLNNFKDNHLNITLKFYKNEDILNLLFIIRHLQNNKCGFYSKLIIDYMPYSRMDRSQNSSCFTLKYIIELICMYFKNIVIIEPHSDITKELFIKTGNLIDFKVVHLIPELCSKILKEHQEVDTICFPDKGARNRYGEMEYFKNLSKAICYCDKVRDFDTGNITGLNLCDMPEDAKNILILDDLCSKGGTFYHTANKLKENGAENVYLGVCHMESTVLSGDIVKKDSNIKKIYCTNSMCEDYSQFHPIYGSVDNNKIKCYNLMEFEEYREIFNNG